MPGLPAVVAELGATALMPTGEAGTLSTAVGDDSVAVGRRQSVLGGAAVPTALPVSPHSMQLFPSLAQPGRAVTGPSSTLSQSSSPCSREPGDTPTSSDCSTAFPIQHPHSSPGASQTGQAWPRAPTLAVTHSSAARTGWDISLSRPNPTRDQVTRDRAWKRLTGHRRSLLCTSWGSPSPPLVW